MDPLFDIGSMTGLMTLFWRHFAVWTNFKILLAESRPYWLQVGLPTGAGAAGVRRPQGGPECLQGHGNAWQYHWLGPGNTNPRRWVVPSRYTLLVVPSRHHPGYASPLPTGAVHTAGPATVTLGHAHMTVLRRSKEILGVE